MGPPPLLCPCRSYLPLEVLNGNLGQLPKADMFALGATLLELAMRSELPSGGQQYQDLRAGKLPLLPTCTQRFTNLIRYERWAGWVGADESGAAWACLGLACNRSAERVWLLLHCRSSLMSPNPADRPSAAKVLESPLLARRGGSPRGQAPLAQQPSTANTQSAVTSMDVAPAPAPAPPAKKGGLVLSRSTAAH